MRSSSNNLTNTLLIVVVIIGCVIFMANSWVSGEIENTQKITAPANINQSFHKKPRNNSLANEGSTVNSNGMSSNSENELSAVPKQKRQKIIYEIPLDDVNLLQ